jgi:hypothetical protein
MRTIGLIALSLWLPLMLFSIIAKTTNSVAMNGVLERHQRTFNILNISLMLTWILLLALARIFAT